MKRAIFGGKYATIATILNSFEVALSRPAGEILRPERYRDTHQQGMERHSSTGESNVIANTIESYTRDRSEAQFTHGLCPDCAEKIYGKFHKEER